MRVPPDRGTVTKRVERVPTRKKRAPKISNPTPLKKNRRSAKERIRGSCWSWANEGNARVILSALTWRTAKPSPEEDPVFLRRKKREKKEEDR